MVRLAAGDEAPRFTLRDQNGRRVSLTSFKGKKVLIYFYPEADTPGCTEQACSVRDSWSSLVRKKVAVVGISPDEPEAQKSFGKKFSLGFPLLADVDHKVAEAYGAWGEKVFFGNTIVGIIRSSFLVGEDGRIRKAWYRVPPAKMVPRLLEALTMALLLAVSPAAAWEKKVDVGGFKLNLRCNGEGSPVVVMDSGVGDTSATWDWVTPEVKRFTRVCSYDRAGLGKSAPGPKPRSADRMMEELHNLLRRAGVRAPYVLAGHSLGGINVRVYAARYPGEVAGLVLVDATQEDFPAMEAAILTPAEREKTRTAVANAPEAVRDELDAIPQSVAALRGAGPGPDVPVTIVSGAHLTDSEKFRAAWVELQDRLAASYPKASRVLAAKSGHYVPFDQPEVVVDAIREMVEKVRAKR